MSAILYNNVTCVRIEISGIIESLQDNINLNVTETFIIRAIVESYDPEGTAKDVIFKAIKSDKPLKQNHINIMLDYDTNLYSYIRTSMGVSYRDYLNSRWV